MIKYDINITNHEYKKLDIKLLDIILIYMVISTFNKNEHEYKINDFNCFDFFSFSIVLYILLNKCINLVFTKIYKLNSPPNIFFT